MFEVNIEKIVIKITEQDSVELKTRIVINFASIKTNKLSFSWRRPIYKTIFLFSSLLICQLTPNFFLSTDSTILSENLTKNSIRNFR